jgi:hypothetical protein
MRRKILTLSEDINLQIKIARGKSLDLAFDGSITQFHSSADQTRGLQTRKPENKKARLKPGFQ